MDCVVCWSLDSRTVQHDANSLALANSHINRFWTAVDTSLAADFWCSNVERYTHVTKRFHAPTSCGLPCSDKTARSTCTKSWPPTSLSSIAPHLAYLAHDSFSLKSLLKHEVLLPRLIWIHIDIHILFRYNPTIYLSSITALLLAIKNGAVSKSDKIHRSYIEKQASSGSLSIYSSVGWILRALAILTVRDGVRLRHKYLVPVQIGRRSE